MGLADLGVGQLDELVDKLLPCVTQDVSLKPLEGDAHPWRTSYLSTDSFFHNKYGERDAEQQVAFCLSFTQYTGTICRQEVQLGTFRNVSLRNEVFGVYLLTQFA